jgi:hypothetical protein
VSPQRVHSNKVVESGGQGDRIDLARGGECAHVFQQLVNHEYAALFGGTVSRSGRSG